MTECKYCDLKVGDLFSLNCSTVFTYTAGGNIRSIKGDKRLFRKEQEGASMVIDEYGNKVEEHDWRMYPYTDMPVWKVVISPDMQTFPSLGGEEND